jgi:TPR repeat protein
MFVYGQGTARDVKSAMHWMRKAAEQGHKGAQYNLGKIFRDGDGITPNIVAAVYWFRRAASQGHARAQSRLSTRYVNGEGVQANNIQALFWAILAAKQGEQLAVKIVNTLRQSMKPADVELAERHAAAWKAKPEG